MMTVVTFWCQSYKSIKGPYMNRIVTIHSHSYSPKMWIMLFAVLIFSVSKCFASSGDTLQPVIVQLKWFHQFQFAGYYAALQQGYYEKEGLDVTLQPGGPKVQVDQEVLSGRAEYGVLASELIQKKTIGQPLVLLAVIMQHSTRAIIVRADGEINSPADLVGKRLMINRNEDTEFEAMFTAEGLSYDRLSITSKDKTANKKFISGEIDALNGSIGNQPFLFNSQGIKVRLIRPISYGIDFYGDSLFTSEQHLDYYPGQVKKFRRATLRGWEYAMNNVDEIIDLIISEYSPGKSRDHLLFEAEAMKQLIVSDLVDIGHINPDRIERIAQLYADRGVISGDYSLKGFIYDPSGNNVDLTNTIIFLSLILVGLAVFGTILLLFNSRLKRRVAERTQELDLSHISLVEEIVEKKKIETELRASNSLLNAVIEGTTDAIFLKNLDGQYLLANSSTLKAIGKEEHEVLGKSDSELFPVQSAVVVKEADAKVMRSGVSQLAEERLETSYGDSYWLANKSPHRDSEGNIIGLIGISRNVTKLKQIEKEKEALQARLNQAQKMESIGTLAGGIAHDFNNLLAVILGYAEMARDVSQKGTTVADDLDHVLEAGNRAKGLVQQILAFSHQTEVEPLLFQPASIIKESIKMLRPTLPSTIEVLNEIDPAAGPIMADPTQINQILMNLCTNAYHAMEETGGKLEITLSETHLNSDDLIHEPNIETGAFIKLSVSDSGIGMHPEVKDKIFEPYFTTKEVGKGSGMGLSIVHGIVKSYGGFLSFESELNRGTTVDVFLPIIESEMQPVSNVVEKIPIGNEKILFVDDEEILANMGKEMLQSLGYDVTVKSSSIEALEIFVSQPGQFDLIITDQTMPGITGAELSKKMMKIRPEIPIILCTGYSTIVSKEQAELIGIKEFALKPISKADIAKLVRSVLDNTTQKDNTKTKGEA